MEANADAHEDNDAVAPAADPAPAQPEGFDPTRYSLTITLFLVFVVAKALVYLDIIDV